MDAWQELDETCMRAALEHARRAGERGEVPIGALVTGPDGVLGAGENSSLARHDPTAHAEIVALREAGRAMGNYRLVGTTLYCTIEPCLMCVGAALHARVSRLVYGASDPKVGAAALLGERADLAAGVNHRIEVRGGVLAGECAERLVAFFRQRRVRSPFGEVPKWS